MKEVEKEQLTLRRASMDDCSRLLSWRNDAHTRSVSRDQSFIDEASHREWLRSCLSRQERTLLIAEIDCVPVGTVRLDFGDVCEVSWTVAPEARGRGIGRRMVAQAVEMVAMPMVAVTRVDNIASQKIAESAGFQIAERDRDWVRFVRPSEARKSDA